MAQLKNTVSGVVVSVSDETATLLGSGWEPVKVPAKTTRSSKSNK